MRVKVIYIKKKKTGPIICVELPPGGHYLVRDLLLNSCLFIYLWACLLYATCFHIRVRSGAAPEQWFRFLLIIFAGFSRSGINTRRF